MVVCDNLSTTRTVVGMDFPVVVSLVRLLLLFVAWFPVEFSFPIDSFKMRSLVRKVGEGGWSSKKSRDFGGEDEDGIREWC
jgi:hypothetical protein